MLVQKYELILSLLCHLCHLYFDSLKENFQKIIEKSINNNITAILSINTKNEDFENHYNLIKNYKSIFISYGLHPEYVNNKNIISTKKIISISNNSKVIGIGETGIDLYHSTEHIKSQFKSFENHIEAVHKEKLYQCDQCEFKMNLNEHIRNYDKKIKSSLPR